MKCFRCCKFSPDGNGMTFRRLSVRRAALEVFERMRRRTYLRRAVKKYMRRKKG